jgi:hypothetical protein
MRAEVSVVLATVMLVACERSEPITAAPEAETATLYRNSFLVSEMRIHWATFDADDGPGYNTNNCMMAARLLNANLIASADAEGKQPYPSVGFWCEPGTFHPEGRVPASFEADYPTDV